jgi:hypothetical protein
VTLHVRIDSVVLDGVRLEPRHATALRQTIGAELARVIAATPAVAWRDSRRMGYLRAGTVRVTTPEQLGTATARALHAALTGVSDE